MRALKMRGDPGCTVTMSLASTLSRTRTSSNPLLSGDFVEMGTLTSGTTITPFLISNGANGGTNTYTPNPEDNPDGIQHFVSLAVSAVLDSPYLLIGIEDLYNGGDEDYNDLVFALDIGATNVEHLVSATVPLPSSVVALIGPALFLFIRRVRHSGKLVFGGKRFWRIGSGQTTTPEKSK